MKKLHFNKTNSYASSKELEEKAEKILSIHFKNEEDRPATHVEFINFLLQKNLELSTQDHNQKIADLELRLQEKSKQVIAYEEDNGKWFDKNEALKKQIEDSDETIKDLNSIIDDEYTLLFDDEQAAKINKLAAKIKMQMPEASNSDVVYFVLEGFNGLCEASHPKFQLPNGKTIRF